MCFKVKYIILILVFQLSLGPGFDKVEACKLDIRIIFLLVKYR